MTLGGFRPLNFILSQFQVRPLDSLDVIFGRLGLRILFSSCLRFGTYFILRGFSPLYFSCNLHFWLEREQNQPWLMKATAKLASNCNGYTATKVYKVYFIEHCWHIYQIHRYKSPHLETLLFLNFHVKILKSTQAKGCQILYFFCSWIAAST